MTIHFVCRGNVFRSFIAEAYLNSLQIPGMKVLSSGTVAAEYKQRNASSYPKMIELLKKHSIERFAKKNYGDDLTQEKIKQSAILIFMNRLAYEEALNKFHLPKEVIVWNIADINETDQAVGTIEERQAYCEFVYSEIAKNINKVLETLNTSSSKHEQ